MLLLLNVAVWNFYKVIYSPFLSRSVLFAITSQLEDNEQWHMIVSKADIEDWGRWGGWKTYPGESFYFNTCWIRKFLSTVTHPSLCDTNRKVTTIHPLQSKNLWLSGHCLHRWNNMQVELDVQVTVFVGVCARKHLPMISCCLILCLRWLALGALRFYVAGLCLS